MTPTRLRELSAHLHMRARINETYMGEPLDLMAIRQWAPMLREAAEALAWAAERLASEVEVDHVVITAPAGPHPSLLNYMQKKL